MRLNKKKIKYVIIMLLGASILIFSILLANESDKNAILTSSIIENKKIGWGIKRNNNHEQPDVGSKNREVLENNNGICLGNKEKKILYLVRSENKYRLSDNKLYDLDDVLSVPTLINYIPESNEKKFVNAFKNIDNNIISMISEIEYSKTSYDSDRFLLYMNDGNMVYVTTTKLKSLNKYVDIVSKLENKKGILYLDSGNYFEIKEK